MSHDAFNPSTSKSRLSQPLNGILYTTTRSIPREKPLPRIGDTMESELGPSFATSRIISVTDGPDASKGILTITHATIPTEAEQMAGGCWDHATCDIGGQKFDAFTIVLYLLESEYSESSPANGSAAPDYAPFGSVGYLLAGRQSSVGSSQLDPVFRAERRTYVKRVNTVDVMTNPQFGISSKRTTKLYYRGESTTAGPIQVIIANQTNPFWGVQLDGTIREGQQLTHDWFAITETVHTVPSETIQLNTNWEPSNVSVGIGQFQGIAMKVVILASAFQPATPVLNSALPAGSIFSGQNYVLYSRECVRSGYDLEPLFRVEQRVYVRKITLRQNDFDEQFGQNLLSTQTLYHKDEIVSDITAEALFASPSNAYWGLQSNGYVREGRQLTPDWYVITDRQVVPASLLSGGRTYTTALDYLWPAVLSTLNIDPWPRKDGQIQCFVNPLNSKEEYRGPCKAEVVETFSKDAVTPALPSVMMPLSIHMSSPFMALSIGPTLHPGFGKSVTSGTNDPEYEFYGANFTFPPTSPPDWPTSILASDEVRPFRGGFLRTRTTIFPPTFQ